ncbi:hypothetical protein SASPL_139753 [Salvia splendens]|uniref:AP2/ERF domain-containing protein n=1 Tax=Salvia splendens TaxID=180675 RepID=A0A8X8ZB97_SALSN|nr:hypothetical protein SASPL_139753 [Salvia splendens]
MEMALGESEVYGKRQYSCMTDCAAPEMKCVKRRRRGATASVLGSTQPVQQQENDSISAPKTVQRSSRFRGVSRHKWTGRYEAHLWDKLTWNVTQKKKGKQGAYDDEEAAARAYDLAALKYWGTSTFTNFPIPDYEKELHIMQTATKEEYLASLRRKSSGFSRGASIYRGVARMEDGKPGLEEFLEISTSTSAPTVSTEEEAAQAYDIAAIEYRGTNAVTNFELSSYIRWLNPRANNSVPLQELKASTNQPDALSPLCLSKKPHFSCLPATPCNINPMATSMQEEFKRNTGIGSCNKSSSPTALGLLLRSSNFKELVEKNSNLSGEESSDEKMNNLQQSTEGRDMFYSVPFSLSSNSHWIELQG